MEEWGAWLGLRFGLTPAAMFASSMAMGVRVDGELGGTSRGEVAEVADLGRADHGNWSWPATPSRLSNGSVTVDDVS